MRRVRLMSSAIVLVAVASIGSHADDEPAYKPTIAEASDEGRLAIAGFRVPEGMQATLFAAEPLLANPVAFCIDERGRFYVAETYRQQKGVEDNRSHMVWLHDDLAAQTLDDRRSMFEKHLGAKVDEYAKEHDRLRLVEDRDGDGVADHASVFADGFNDVLDGTGAGVLARGGDVYYTCIPHLWQLKDADGDGRSEARKSLSYGYGVRVAFRGHDSHGLKLGPDGRLYFSIGDRGYNIRTKEGKHLKRSDTGAVFRCELDGSNLEVFAYGLRNPQELAFDNYGNLFTGDNNSDSGDKARWVYVVEGGDTGWRMYYQYLPDRGPFNREKIWHPHHEGQPAYIVPPVANIADGPSGLVHYPGVGLSPRYRDHFFLADFRGTAVRSGIRSFAVKPKGATFELVDSHEFLWSILATDVDFGYDGNMYVSDWVNGWDGAGKGRIYKFRDKLYATTADTAESAKVMQKGFGERSTAELVELLGHADQRVRLEAQFALAKDDAAAALRRVAFDATGRLSRLHAIWGLGQIGRRSPEVLEPLVVLLDDRAHEVRAQSAKVLGEGPLTSAAPQLIAALDDKNARVRFYAAQSLGKIGDASAVEPLLQLLAENADRDPMLRHAAVMGLLGTADSERLVTAARNTSPAARMGVLLAMRRRRMPEIAMFLDDPESLLIDEAARAIHDKPITGALPQLAKLAGRPGLSDALLRRVLSANFRLGTYERAVAVADIAGNPQYAEALRLEAVAELEQWNDPAPLDRVLGAWRPIGKRSTGRLADAIRPALPTILGGSKSLRSAGARLAAAHGVNEVGPLLYRIATDAKGGADERVAALDALAALRHARLKKAVDGGLGDDAPQVRSAALRILATVDKQRAVPLLGKAIETGTTSEQQQAIAALAGMQTASADAIVLTWLGRLVQGEASEAIQLDLIEAGRGRNTTAMRERLERFEANRDKQDPLAQYRETLVGGNAARGEQIFFGRSDASCRRCHMVRGSGGEVGPDLSAIAVEKKREYLLESLVLPNAQIAKGFESTMLATVDGKIHVGIVKSEDEKSVRLMTADGSIVAIATDDVDDRASGKSAMPEDLVKTLSKADIRDLVEYLSTLKTAASTTEHK